MISNRSSDSGSDWQFSPPVLDTLIALDTACFEDPWSTERWATLFNRPERFLLFLIRQSDLPVSYWVFSRVLDEVELLRTGTDPDFRGKGIARWAVNRILPQLKLEGCQRVLLEVRDSNQPAIQLYRSSGFVLDGRRANYYPKLGDEDWEDALLMSRSL